MDIQWPDLTFPPIHLWTMPKMNTVQPKEQDPMRCPKCNGPIMALRSKNLKICYDCGSKYDWLLKPGQEPLIKHQR